jgi:phosphatidylserine decarboxylase
LNRNFSGWREGARFYLPFLVAGAGFLLFQSYTAAVVCILLGLCFLAFFRDPARTIPPEPKAVVAPADGTVVAIEDLTDSPHYDGPCKRISIFLSVFNVHVNRMPLGGTIRHLRYQPGGFRNAMKAETSLTNESNALWLDTEFGPCTVRQITGAVARRIVCVVQEGQTCAKGDRFGMIRFGSRTELYLPVQTEITVTLRQKVKGGSTIVARFP